MPTTPSASRKSVKAIQKLLAAVYLGREVTAKEWAAAQAEVGVLKEADPNLDAY